MKIIKEENEKMRFTKDEWKALDQDRRAELLSKDQERKSLEGAISRIGHLVSKNKDYRYDWETIKKHLNRLDSNKLTIE